MSIVARGLIAAIASAAILALSPLGLSSPASTRVTNVETAPPAIVGMKAMLFYEDKGAFSPDVSEADVGPPYVPPRLWNTPMQYENRATSVLVTVEVSGEEGVATQKLEFSARYIPLRRRAREIVITKTVPINFSSKVKERDNYHAGFWLYDVGCEPVRWQA